MQLRSQSASFKPSIGDDFNKPFLVKHVFFGSRGHGMYLPDDESDRGCFLRGGFTTLPSISHHFRGNPFPPNIKHPIGTI